MIFFVLLPNHGDKAFDRNANFLVDRAVIILIWFGTHLSLYAIEM